MSDTATDKLREQIEDTLLRIEGHVSDRAQQALLDLFSQTLAAYQEDLISKLPKKQYEHPIDPQTGAAVETYGYEEQHNKLIDQLTAIIRQTNPAGEGENI